MICLVPMLETDLHAYLDVSVPGYAADNVKAGYWSEEESLEKSREAYNKLMPDGVKTKNQHIFKI